MKAFREFFKMRKRTGILLIAAFLLLAGIAVYLNQKEKAPGIGAFSGANVVLITIDTLRADHLPAYGYTRIQTPAIDRLAQEGLVFEDVIAHNPMTLPSHASILTALLPMGHGIRDNAGYKLEPRITTLAEVLRTNGYRTAAFVSSFVLDSQFGLDQGFDLYSDTFTLANPRVSNTDTQRSAEETQAEVDAWLEKNNPAKFFLWVHYYDPHDPYEPPATFQNQALPYDGEIVYTDHVLARLLNRLEPLKQNTIVIVAGDHGESLGEHKEQTHSLFIYNATQHVPLIIRLPDQTHGRVPGLAGLIDIAPTILEWLGMKPDPAMQGKSLIPLIQNNEQPQHNVYSESLFAELHYGWSPLKSLTTDNYKYIDAPNPELYDRKKDRSETQNLAQLQPDIVRRLQEQLSEIITGQTRSEGTIPTKMDPEAEEKLRALGYVGTTVAGTPESRKIDPKDRIEVLENISAARKAMDQKDPRTALRIVEEVLKKDSGMVDAHFIAATAHLHLGEKEKAVEQMMATIRLKPDHTQTLYNLAFYHQLTGNQKEAETWYLQLLKYEPEHLLGNLNLVSLYRQTNQSQKAEERLRKVLTLYEEATGTTNSADIRSGLLEKMAEIHYKIGNVKKSEELIQQALQLTPGRAMLHYHLGVIYQAQKKEDAARQEYSKALELANKDEMLRRAVQNQLQSMR